MAEASSEGITTTGRLALLDALPEAVIVIDGGGRVRWVNGSGLGYLGYELGEVIGTVAFDHLHPDDLGYMLSSWDRREGNPGEPGLIVQGRARRSDGTWWPCEVIGMSLLDDPDIRGMVITARDLSKQAALADSPGRMRSMVDRTTDIVLLISADGAIAYANRRLTGLLGHDADRVVDSPWTDLVATDDLHRAFAWFERLVSDGDGASSRINLRLTGSADRSLSAELHGTNQLADPLIGGVIVAARDVEEVLAMQRALEEHNERLTHAATHDALTGLTSRRAFVEAVELAIQTRRRAGSGDEIVVLFCDLDGFKEVNDRHGHAVGDRVLQETAARLRDAAREDDVVGRYGGDEFTVLLGTGESAVGVAALVARLTSALEAPVVLGDVTARIGVSVGVARARATVADVDALLSSADEAMYVRKRARAAGPSR